VCGWLAGWSQKLNAMAMMAVAYDGPGRYLWYMATRAVVQARAVVPVAAILLGYHSFVIGK